MPRYLGAGAAMTWVVHERPISGGEAARAGWRVLLAELLADLVRGAGQAGVARVGPDPFAALR